MKPRLILLIVQLVLIIGTADAQTLPRNEFELHLSPTSISLASGETDSVSISVLRSKLYKKGNVVLNFASPERKGIGVSILPIPDQPDNYLLRISANDEAEQGKYNIIPSCTLNNKSKGVILKVKVN